MRHELSVSSHGDPLISECIVGYVVLTEWAAAQSLAFFSLYNVFCYCTQLNLALKAEWIWFVEREVSEPLINSSNCSLHSWALSRSSLCCTEKEVEVQGEGRFAEMTDVPKSSGRAEKRSQIHQSLTALFQHHGFSSVIPLHLPFLDASSVCTSPFLSWSSTQVY